MLELLRSELRGLIDGGWRPLDVLDVGGGTGGVAVALASDGHRLTVVDPSPDALASLDRRAAEAGVSAQVRALQGDATDVVRLLGTDVADVVVCHRVLDVVDRPDAALEAMRRVLRPGGMLSLLVPQKHALVLSQALAGHVALARRSYADSSRFDHAQVLDLVARAGFVVVESQGIGAVADHVAESLLDAEPRAYAELAALEHDICRDPFFRPLAPQLHVFAQVVRGRPASI